MSCEFGHSANSSKSLMRSQVQPCGNAGISPSGKYVSLTGHKTVVVIWGGWASHGGVCLSRKDSRQVSRNLRDLLDESVDVLSRTGEQGWSLSDKMDCKIHRILRLSSRFCVHSSFHNGATYPMSMLIDMYGTSAMSTAELEVVVKRHFTLQLGAVVLELELLEPIYLSTARDGHFADPLLPWEQPKMLRAF